MPDKKKMEDIHGGNMKNRKRWMCAGMSLAAFGLLTGIMHVGLTRLTGFTQAACLAGLFSLILFVCMLILDIIHPLEEKQLACMGGFLFLTILARVLMLDYVSSDYVYFLSGWTKVFRDGGLAMLGENVGDYNLLYQYVLLLIASTPLPDLYMIKYFSILFDYALALGMLFTSERLSGRPAGIPVLVTVLLLPTVLIDGACWAQCDSVYVFFIVLSLGMMKDGKPNLAAALLGISFAFKLQTIFFFPVVLLGLLHGEYKTKHALTFFSAYFVTMIPALLAGRSLASALSVYFGQSMGQYYHRLTYNAPTLYAFFPLMEFKTTDIFGWMRFIGGIDNESSSEWLNPDLYPTLQQAALMACILLVLLIVLYWLFHSKEITRDMTLCFALFFAILLPFVMPKIHDRYFFLADLLAVLYAYVKGNRAHIPLLVVTSSYMCYMPFLTRQHPIDNRILSLMMLLALLSVGRDLLTEMRRNRTKMKGGAPCRTSRTA